MSGGKKRSNVPKRRNQDSASAPRSTPPPAKPAKPSSRRRRPLVERIAIHLIWAIVLILIVLFLCILGGTWMIVDAVVKLGGQILDRNPWETVLNAVVVIATAALAPTTSVVILIVANRRVAKLLDRWDREASEGEDLVTTTDDPAKDRL